MVLSGTATEGTLGLEATMAEGRITLAQDESARYDSMPRSAIAAGCVGFHSLVGEHCEPPTSRVASKKSL